MLIRGSQIQSGTIADLQIAASAGILTTKLADGANLFFRDGTRALTGNMSAGGFAIQNVLNPVNPQDAVTLSYLNTLNLGMTMKVPVRVATLSSLGTGYSSGVLTIPTTTTLDGLTLASGDRILVRAESTAAWNGIYTYTNSTTLTRSTDMNSGGSSGNIQMGDFIIVDDGATYRGQAFILTEPFNFTPPIVLGTTALTFTAYGAPGTLTGGNGINISSNVITAVANTAQAINVTGSGIGLTLNDNSLQFVSSGLAVKPYTGLATTTNGLNVVTGNGLTSAGGAGSAITVLPVVSGGISVGASGLAILLGSNTGLVTSASGLSVILADSTLSLVTGGLKLAALNSGNLLVGNSSNVATSVTLSGDATLSNTGVLTLTTAASGGAVRASNFSNGELCGGTANGSNTAFTTAFTMIANTECVYVNGIRQKRTTDYAASGTTITFVVAPFTGDIITNDYIH
jgi:hypothetical protein